MITTKHYVYILTSFTVLTHDYYLIWMKLVYYDNTEYYSGRKLGLLAILGFRSRFKIM